MNRRNIIIMAAALMVIGVVAQYSSAGAQEEKIIAFDTMVGVHGPYLGATNRIRGIRGGGAAWTISEGRGELKANGNLEITVRGLVLAATGAQPRSSFRAVVSCQTIDESGSAAVVNVSTDNFPATMTGDPAGAGNADIEETLNLPSPCFAPIILIVVTASGGTEDQWFAITGN